MNTLLADIRFGLRMLLKSPTTTFVALLALTLGIGANTAIFSVVNGVLLRTFPYPDAERIVLVWEKSPRNDQNSINLGNFFDWKDQNQVFTDMAIFFDRNFNLTGDGEPEEVTAQIGTTNLFSVLGTNPILGRTFVDDDGRDEQSRVVVISYALWQRRFGGDKNIVGRRIDVNERPSTIVGVMPATFGWHIQKGTQASRPADIWIPFQVPNELRQRRGRFASAVARLKPGVSIDQAKQEMATIGARLAQQYPEFNTNWSVNVVPLRNQTSFIHPAGRSCVCAFDCLRERRKSFAHTCKFEKKRDRRPCGAGRNPASHHAAVVDRERDAVTDWWRPGRAAGVVGHKGTGGVESTGTD